MTPSRPYFLRAIYEWLNDNYLSPYVLVDAKQAGVVVPTAHVQDGKIVLNIMPSAVRDLFMHNDALSFSARFGGVPMQVYVPMQAILAIYARENGEGMFFDEPENFAEAAHQQNISNDDKPEPPTPSAPSAGGKSFLRVVK